MRKNLDSLLFIACCVGNKYMVDKSLRAGANIEAAVDKYGE